MKALWIIVAVCAVLGGCVAVAGVMSAQSAVQEGAAAGMGLGLAVIPYCLARACSEIGSGSRSAAVHLESFRVIERVDQTLNRFGLENEPVFTALLKGQTALASAVNLLLKRGPEVYGFYFENGQWLTDSHGRRCAYEDRGRADDWLRERQALVNYECVVRAFPSGLGEVALFGGGGEL